VTTDQVNYDGNAPYGDAPKGQEPISDPGLGAQSRSAPRAVRGGSWIDGARRARSADRFADERARTATATWAFALP
jgi:hypothetical protein